MVWRCCAAVCVLWLTTVDVDESVTVAPADANVESLHTKERGKGKGNTHGSINGHSGPDCLVPAADHYCYCNSYSCDSKTQLLMCPCHSYRTVHTDADRVTLNQSPLP
jgi:hypothetical protein